MPLIVFAYALPCAEQEVDYESRKGVREKIYHELYEGYDEIH
jgi:hypothetical protein